MLCQLATMMRRMWHTPTQPSERDGEIWGDRERGRNRGSSGLKLENLYLMCNTLSFPVAHSAPHSSPINMENIKSTLDEFAPF